MSNVVNAFVTAQNQLLRYIPLITLVSGTLGNTLNCLLFTRRSLRQNSCSNYFLAASIANFFGIYFGCLTRLLIGFNIYPSPSQIGLYCKTRTFFTYIGLTGSTWFIVGACADRYASSSSTVCIRSFSQVKTSRRIIILTAISIVLIYLQTIFCFDGSYILVPRCLPFPGFCYTFNNANLLVTYSLCPPIIMLILGAMTISNIRSGSHLRRQTSSKDRQLTVMLLIQVTSFTILAVPTTISKIYEQITLFEVKSAERVTIESFFTNLTVLLSFINTSTSFYLFTLSGTVFRKQLKILFCSNQRQATVTPVETMPGRRRLDKIGTSEK